MANESVPPVRFHRFESPVSGSSVCVIERHGRFYLEDPLGATDLCRITGPEILKLSEQGRALWAALNEVLDLPFGPLKRVEAAWERGRAVLAATAATFDRNELKQGASAPKFGEWFRGRYAGESNPHRDGMFVRSVRCTGRINPGVWYELTDGKGHFWQYEQAAVVRLDSPPMRLPENHHHSLPEVPRGDD